MPSPDPPFTGRKQTALALASHGYFNISDELPALLTVFSMMAAVVQLNFVFYNVATAFLHRRQATAVTKQLTPCFLLIPVCACPVYGHVICDSRRVATEIIPETKPERLTEQNVFVLM